MTDPKNRRKFPRHGCDALMDAMKQAARPAFECHALNASDGGLLIETDAPLAPGQRFAILLRGDDASRVVDAEVEVIWAKVQSGRTHAGLKYLRRREGFVV